MYYHISEKKIKKILELELVLWNHYVLYIDLHEYREPDFEELERIKYGWRIASVIIESLGLEVIKEGRWVMPKWYTGE